LINDQEKNDKLVGLNPSEDALVIELQKMEELLPKDGIRNYGNEINLAAG